MNSLIKVFISFLSLILLSVNLFAKENSAKELCESEFKKEVIDKNKLQEYCNKAGWQFMKKKEITFAIIAFIRVNNLSAIDKALKIIEKDKLIMPFPILIASSYSLLGKDEKAKLFYQQAFVLNKRKTCKELKRVYDKILPLYSNLKLINPSNICEQEIKKIKLSKSEVNLSKSEIKKLKMEQFMALMKMANKEMHKIEKTEDYKNIFKNDPKRFLKDYNVYIVKGEYSKARKSLLKSIEFTKKKFGKHHHSVADSYDTMGEHYMKFYNYKEAIYFFKKGLHLRENYYKDNKQAISKSYYNIATANHKLNNFNDSIIQLNKALKLIEKLHDTDIRSVGYGKLFYIDMLDIYNLLVINYTSIDNKKALFYNKKLSVLVNDGQEFIKYNRKEKKHLIQRMQASWRFNRLEESVNNNFGLLYQHQKNYRKSLYYFKKLEKRINTIGKIRKYSSDIQVLNSNIGQIYDLIRDYKKAYKYIKKAFNIYKTNQVKDFSILDNSQKLLYVKTNKDIFELLLYSSIKYKETLLKDNNIIKVKDINQVTFNDWLNYKGSIFDNENTIAMMYDKINDKELRKKIKQLYSQKRNLSILRQTIPKQGEEKILKQRVQNLEKNISDSEIYLSSKVEEYKEELELRDINYKDISSYLKDDEFYIDYAKAGDNYYIFTIDNKDNITYKQLDENDTKKIDETIKSFRLKVKDISSKKSIIAKDINKLTKDSQNNLSVLYKLLLNKYLSKELKDKNSLIISPDGLLNLLPFEALYNDSNKKYLIEQKNIRYIPSGKEFVRLIRKNSKDTIEKKNIAVFSNPDFGIELKSETDNDRLESQNINRSAVVKSLFKMRFSPLPGSQKEADYISNIFKNTDSYNKKNATEKNLLQLQSPKILHLSTHGFFLKDKDIKNPLLKSGLALAGANKVAKRRDGEGIVTGLKLSGLDLKDTELVVLSACETGVGDINEAGGVVGLNKAFIKAGAKNVVMTLWSVADKQSADLINDFYHNIKNKKDYTTALQDAKLKMIKDGLHPYFWSGFVINGI